MSNQGQAQAQAQAHVLPLDLSHQSCASTTSCLMESHKLEEKHFSSKTGKWDMLFTDGPQAEESVKPIWSNLESYHRAQPLPFLLCAQG